MIASNSRGFSVYFSFLGKTLSIVLLAISAQPLSAQKIEYLEPVPLTKVISTPLSPVKTTGSVKVPITTAAGDIVTIHAAESGFFKAQGLNISLSKENNFKEQVEKCLSGETPYLRGTMGMINSATEVFKERGTELVLIYQVSWSEGSYALVVKKDKTLKNINTVALQLYGPQMHYAANLFSNAGRLNEVEFKWLEERTLAEKTQTKITDPVSAFKADPSIDAVMCVITDALALTSNGTVGTGADGSVKDATILVSTKTASRIIAGVYAVRKDYFDAHKGEVMKFVKAMMLAEESLQQLKKNKSGSEFQKLLTASAGILGITSEAADADDLLRNTSFAGFTGNVSFFTGKGTLRDMTALNNEIQNYLLAFGLIQAKVNIKSAGWDYNALSQGLSNIDTIPVEQKFDAEKVTKKVEEQISVQPAGWEDEGTLFTVEITFVPNQHDFPASMYATDFRKALEMAQTYSGALIVIEGHSGPLAIQKAIEAGEPEQLIAAKKQKAKSLSLERAENVRKNFIAYAHDNGIEMDESQIIAVGFGIARPKYEKPVTEEQWKANSRVVFRVKEIEAEMSEFVPDFPTQAEAQKPDVTLENTKSANTYRGVVNESPAATTPVNIGEYYALIIGIDAYSGTWNPLGNAVNDAKAVEQTLRQHYKFDHFRTLYDKEATGENIIHGLEWLVDSVKENDNVLIYFSGHGHYNKSLDKGYWVPIEAQTTSTAHFISNSVIQDFLKGVASKHTLLLSDACFSGDIFRGNTTVENPPIASEKYFNTVYTLKSRQAISSGGLEPVMDGGKDGHSVFTYYLLQALEKNNSQYMDAEQLYSAIKIPVVNNSNQSPIFSPVHNTGDEGGQFLFIKK